MSLERLLVVVFALAAAPAAPAAAQPPILDVHLHASLAADQGPPPLAMCTPFQGLDAWDPRRPFTDQFMERVKTPTCSDPIWSPTTETDCPAHSLRNSRLPHSAPRGRDRRERIHEAEDLALLVPGADTERERV